MDKAKAEMINKDVAIATLEKQLAESAAELEEMKVKAIASLESELAAGNKQLTLFLGQDTTPIPGQILSPEQTTGTLSRGELVQYILEKFPEAKINGQKITDAIAGKSKNLPKFEATYGFKYLGKIDGVSRFQPIPNP